MASLKKRGEKYLIQFYWSGEQRTKTLGAISPSKAQSYKGQVEAALDAIRRGQHPTASRLLDQGFDILDISLPNEKTAHLLKSNGNSQKERLGIGKLLDGNILSVDELVPRYVSYLKVHESDGHWRRVKSRLSHLVEFSGGTSVTSLDGDLLEAYLAARKAQDARDETRKNEITSIRAMLNWSVETGTLESLPVKKFPVIKTDESDPFLFKSDIDLRIAEAASAGEEIDKLANRMVLPVYGPAAQGDLGHAEIGSRLVERHQPIIHHGCKSISLDQGHEERKRWGCGPVVDLLTAHRVQALAASRVQSRQEQRPQHDHAVRGQTCCPRR